MHLRHEVAVFEIFVPALDHDECGAQEVVEIADAFGVG